jgi:enoyl-CoA hydratase/carnithine racemase
MCLHEGSSERNHVWFGPALASLTRERPLGDISGKLAMMLIVWAFELCVHENDIRAAVALPPSAPDASTLGLMPSASLLPKAAARGTSRSARACRPGRRHDRGRRGQVLSAGRAKNDILVFKKCLLEGGALADDRVRLDIDGPIATITNDNPGKHNAFDDAMDVALFEILGELAGHPDVRAVIWRAEGRSFSSGRDVAAIGGATAGLSHHELMKRGHRGILQALAIEAPILVAMKGWSIGASFQRALICDIRVAAEGSRMMLPELAHGVIPDTGGVGRLYQMCGHGVVSDMVLTGRPMDAQEALRLGVVSRVVPAAELDATVREMAEKIASSPKVAVNMARRVIRHLAEPALRASMDDELVCQTFISKSDDLAEMRAARAEGRVPQYTGS